MFCFKPAGVPNVRRIVRQHFVCRPINSVSEQLRRRSSAKRGLLYCKFGPEAAFGHENWTSFGQRQLIRTTAIANASHVDHFNRQQCLWTRLNSTIIIENNDDYISRCSLFYIVLLTIVNP